MPRKLAIAACLFALTSIPLAVHAADATPRKQVTADQLAKTPPDATFEFEAKEFRLIFGGESGKGVLKYKGKDYPFTGKGASIGGIGASEVHAVGTVHFLKNIADFEGTYTGVSAGATVVKGVGSSQFENNKGVILSLKSKSEGLALTLGVNAVEIKLTK